MGTAELRKAAWRKLWEERWFGRLLGVGILLGLSSCAIQGFVGGMTGSLGVLSWFDYAQAVVTNMRDLTTPVPNLTNDFMFRATSSTALLVFFSWLMSGITSYGAAVVLRKCLANEEANWLVESFGGFRMPFGLLWLYARWILVYVGWSFVALGVPALFAGLLFGASGALPAVPRPALAGLGSMVGACWVLWIYSIPFYRYRFLWLVKAEHPEWGAGECLCACRRLMKGNLLRSFRLDCSYWKPITSLLLLAGMSLSFTALSVSAPVNAAFAFAAFAGFLVVLGWSVVLAASMRVGQGLLYRELDEGV